jgi:hypothetical protein
MRIAYQIGLLGLAVALVGGVACTGSDSDTLLGVGSRNGETAASSGGPSSGSLGGAPGDDDDGTGSKGGSSGGVTTLSDGGFAALDGGSPGRLLFEALLPTFQTSCGNTCHAQGGSNAPTYLGGADPYATIKAFPGIVVSNPQASIIITKGAHEGPALPAGLQASLVTWLTAEAATAAASGPPETAPLTVATGANTVDLSKLGIAGASITFTAALSGDVLTLSALTITAPAATGLSLSYPIFYVKAAGGAQTENDDLSNDTQTVGAGTSAPLDTGLLILSGWAATDTLQISFTKLAAATAVDAGEAGGCKDVASFITNAVPAIQANTCLNCHNTGGSGNASLDLSGLASNPANDTAACAQALTRINTTTPAQSDIILAPTGGVANHPFTGASASYVTMMETWIQAEK